MAVVHLEGVARKAAEVWVEDAPARADGQPPRIVVEVADAQLATKVFEPAPGRVQPVSFASSPRPVPPDLERWRQASWFSESERW